MEWNEQNHTWRLTGAELLAQLVDDWQQFKGYEGTPFEEWCKPVDLRTIKIDGIYIANNELSDVHEVSQIKERSKACTYCHNHIDGSPLSRDDYRANRVTGVELGANPYMTPEEIDRIEHCQWCGRKLGEPE